MLAFPAWHRYAGFTGVRLGWTVIPNELTFADGSSVAADFNRCAHFLILTSTRHLRDAIFLSHSSLSRLILFTLVLFTLVLPSQHHVHGFQRRLQHRPVGRSRRA